LHGWSAPRILAIPRGTKDSAVSGDVAGGGTVSGPATGTIPATAAGQLITAAPAAPPAGVRDSSPGTNPATVEVDILTRIERVRLAIEPAGK
jgi:hypothetical protein